MTGVQTCALPISIEALVEAGIVRQAHDGMRLLGDGELKAKLTIEAMHASKSALEAVEKAGGSVKTTFEKKVHMNKKGQPGKKVQRRQKAAEKRAGA